MAPFEPIAIVGIATRLPKDATSATAFWDLVREGRVGITDVPPDRANIDAFYHPNPDRADTVRKPSTMDGTKG